ncbi:MAG: hydroxysqualene dehydroxylase HpnE [Candidatus Kapabacteria bacterium]|nr:hydroxysqualene dehydroxylase HpnE [Candidatus Kapabacteria bacterium]MCS7169065.1 hydroxysqualene dehydroxylase HpnE [Candidatus Kapabacteria bacterium]MDW7997107.1 hydroxysqualene dehydroxylase HpnE [Bacteroidota bacterium]MDW8226031.1 hydroxysqualene dehydroxylase HpnE [Bacteroidota bacterium]
MPQAVVVGAGVAGIAASVHLTLRGWRVTLVEAAAAVGGRATSVWDPVAGEFVDCGQHVFIGAYREFLALLGVLGTVRSAGGGEPLRFLFWDGERRFLFDAGRVPGCWGFLTALCRLPKLGVAGAFRLFQALRNVVASEASETSVTEFLGRFKQAPVAQRVFWEPLTRATLNTAPEEASVALLRVVLREGFLRSAASAQFVVPRSSLLQLLQPIEDWLARHGGELWLNTPAEAVLYRDSWAVCGIRIRGGKVLEADAVVLAVPPWVLPRLVPVLLTLPEYARFLETVRYSPIVTLYLWLKEPVMPETVCAFAHPDLHWAFRRPTRYGAEAVALVTSAADHLLHLPRQELVERCLGAFAAAFPTFRPELLLRLRLMLEQRATLKMSPGVNALRPSGATPWSNLVLAGDWLQTGLPCTLEGAARSGRAAAEALSELCR